MIEPKVGKKLIVTIAILSITFCGEFIGGVIFKSLGLLSDSFHVFSDVFSILIAYAALKIAHQREPTDKMTYGYHRLEVFSAIFNGVTLVAISVYILYEAYRRYSNPAEVKALAAMTIAIVGLAVNLTAAMILRSDMGHKKDINLRSAYLHILGDSGASVAVIVGMLIIAFTRLYIIDAVVAALISLLILVSAIRVLTEGAGILLQQSPADLEKIRTRVRQIDSVIDIADFRLWQVCSHLVIGTAHIITTVEKLEDTESLGKRIRRILEEECDIRHLTLQFETPRMSVNHSHKFEHHHEGTFSESEKVQNRR